MFAPFFDFRYLIFSLPAILMGLLATLLLRLWTGTYMRRQNVNHLSGIDVVERIAKTNGYDIRLEITSGELSDHYDPRSKTVRLSPEVARTTSIAAIAIAA